MKKEFEQLLAQDLPALNESLKTKGQQPIAIPPTKVAVNHEALGSGGGVDRAVGREALGLDASLPDSFRLLPHALAAVNKGRGLARYSVLTAIPRCGAAARKLSFAGSHQN